MAVLPADPIVQRFSNFLATFPYPRKNNPVPGHANALQEPQLAARDNVEAAAQPGQPLQDRKIPVGLHRKANGVVNSAQPLLEFTVSVVNRSAAIQIRRRRKPVGHGWQRHSLAEHLFVGWCGGGLLPREIRRERRRIDKLQFARRSRVRVAHRTFITTSVRSSDRGALLENQSTSLKMLSANSAAGRSWCFSINSRSRVVPKNWPSLLAVSVMPSE